MLMVTGLEEETVTKFNNDPGDGQRLPDHENLPCCNDEISYFQEDGTPVHWLGDFTEQDDDPAGLVALRDMLDAAYLRLETRGTPMAQLYASSLAAELDDMRVGQ